MLLLPVGGSLIDVANGRVWTRSGGASAGKPTTNGVAATFDGVDDFFSFTGYPEITGNVGTFFLWMPRVGVYDTNGHVYWGSNTTASSWFQLDTSHRPFVFGSSIGVAGPDIRSSANRSLVFSSAGTAASKAYFVDGTLQVSGGAGAPVAFAAGNKTFRFGAWAGGVLWDCDMDCVVAGFTTRTWSDAQARAFHENPWQLFEPEPVRIYWPGATAGGVSVTVPAVDVAVAAVAPTVSAGKSVAVPAVDVAVAGVAPTVAAGKSIAVPAVDIAVAGLAPTVVTGLAIAIPAVDIAVAGVAPTVAAGKSVAVPAVDIAIAALAPTVSAGASTTIAIPFVDIAVAGLAPSVAAGKNIAVPAVDVAVQARAPSVQAGAAQLTGRSTRRGRRPLWLVEDSKKKVSPQALREAAAYVESLVVDASLYDLQEEQRILRDALELATAQQRKAVSTMIEKIERRMVEIEEDDAVLVLLM